MLFTGRLSPALFCCFGPESCSQPGSRCRRVPSAESSTCEPLLATSHQPVPALYFATSALPPLDRAELFAPFFSSCTSWLLSCSSPSSSPTCTGQCRCIQESQQSCYKGGCSLTFHNPLARVSSSPWEKKTLGKGAVGGSTAGEPVVARGSYLDGGGNLLQDLCQPPLAETALLLGRKGSTAGKGSSSGPAVGQPCSACMGRNSQSLPQSQISKVNRPLPAFHWVTHLTRVTQRLSCCKTANNSTFHSVHGQITSRSKVTSQCSQRDCGQVDSRSSFGSEPSSSFG